jgi:hypothetical protein
LAAGYALRSAWVDQALGGAASDAGAARHLAGFDVPLAQAYPAVNPVLQAIAKTRRAKIPLLPAPSPPAIEG